MQRKVTWTDQQLLLDAGWPLVNTSRFRLRRRQHGSFILVTDSESFWLSKASKGMGDLPEEIQQALKNMSTSGANPDKIAAYRATIDLYLTEIFTKHLQQLCQELKETRDQMSHSSAVASKQTEALVKTTKWYT